MALSTQRDQPLHVARGQSSSQTQGTGCFTRAFTAALNSRCAGPARYQAAGTCRLLPCLGHPGASDRRAFDAVRIRRCLGRRPAPGPCTRARWSAAGPARHDHLSVPPQATVTLESGATAPGALAGGVVARGRGRPRERSAILPPGGRTVNPRFTDWQTGVFRTTPRSLPSHPFAAKLPCHAHCRDLEPQQDR